jgi:nucleoside-diphosphate-sugar epimerase
VGHRKILAITGGSGRIGSAVRPFLRERYRLRLVDVRPAPQPVLEGAEDFVETDCGDLDATLRALSGVDAVLHLAANPATSATWSEQRTSNIDPTFNVFEAARRARVNKVVFASSNHVMGFYNLESSWPIDVESAIRPDSLYGVSKAFGEALARYFVDAFQLSIICIRIGWFTPDRPNMRHLNALWISARDLAQLFGLALETPRTFGIYNGTSNNTPWQWDLRRTIEELGFAPRDNVASFVPEGPIDERPYVDPQAGITGGIAGQ